MDFLSVWKTFTQPNKIVKQSVHLRLSLLSVQRGKNLKTLIKIEMLRSVEKKVVVRVSAQVSNRGQNIGVARFWASRGNIASQVRGALSSHCSEREGRRGRILACPAIQSQATRRPESSSSARSPRSPRFCSFCREEEQSGIGTETFERSRLQSFDLELSRRRIGRYFFPGDSRCPGVGLPGLGGEETIRFTSASFSSNCCRNLILRLKVSKSDLMLWDCEGLGEKSAVLTKSAQKLPVLTEHHPHSLDRAYPHQKHFDRCCNSRSENFHFPMCYQAVFNQWNWIEFFERLVRSTFVKTSYKEENVLFSGAAMQCEN